MKTKSQKQSAEFIAAYTNWAIENSNTRAKTDKGISEALKAFEGKKKMSMREAYITTLHDSALKNNANYTKAMIERAFLAAYPEFVKAFYSEYIINKSIWSAKAGSMEDIPKSLVEVVKKIASDKIFAGKRLQKTFFGRNMINRSHEVDSGFRTVDNGKYGWDRVVWHYADYTIIFNKSKTKAFIKIGNKFDVAKITNGTISPVFSHTITL